MATEEEISEQEKLLAVHRRTLAHYLRQEASLGTAHTPPGVTHGIAEARKQIKHIKETLRGWGYAAEDEPNDEEKNKPNPNKGALSNANRAMKDIVLAIENINTCLKELYNNPISLLNNSLINELLINIAALVRVYNKSRATLPGTVDRLVKPYKDKLTYKYPWYSGGGTYAAEVHLYLMRLKDSNRYLHKQSERIIKEIRSQSRTQGQKWADRLLFALTIGLIISLIVVIVPFVSVNNIRGFVINAFQSQQKPSNNASFQVFTISEGETKAVLDNNLFISVTDLQPISRQANIVIGYSGQENSNIQFQGIGEEYIYLDRFAIRLNEVDIATFAGRYAEITAVDLTKLRPSEIEQPIGKPELISSSMHTTKLAFNGNIAVTVLNMNLISPQADAIIGQPGFPNQEFNFRGIGSSFIYQGRYEIRLTKVETAFPSGWYSEFAVTKIK